MTSQPLARGANLSLQSALAENSRLSLVVKWTGEPPKQNSVETGVFMVGEDGKVLPGGLIFHQSPTTTFKLHDVAVNAEQRTQRIDIDTAQVPANIVRFPVTLVVHTGGHVQSIRSLDSLSLKVLDGAGAELCRCDFSERGHETALVMGELYRRNGEWKFKCINQGFMGGLRAMSESYGLVVAEAAVGSGVSAAGALSSRMEGEGTVFTPPKTGFGEIVLTLNWAASVRAPVALKPKGLGKLLGAATPQNLDLDLCGLYELADGHRGVVQALGENFGSFNTAPYLQLMGDERRGSAGQASEIIRLNGARWHEVHRFIIYAMIFEGAPNWEKAEARLNIRLPEELPMTVRAQGENLKGRVVSLAYVENHDGKLVLHKKVESYNNPRELDEAYNWGLRWSAGRKD